MLTSIATRVAWVGRTVSMVFGLALVLGLVFGVATMALGANGSNFVLGSINNTATALTKLTANVQGPALQVQNTNPGTDDSALSLSVQPGEAPMRVNSTGRVPNLNADRLDGIDSSGLAAATHEHAGEEITSGTIDEARVDPKVTRDDEILPAVQANDGLGSDLDADKLDGIDSSALLPGGTLPAGTTLRGTYEFDGTASAPNELFGGDSISFVYTLPSTPIGRFVPLGTPPSPECPGSYSSPQAQPGYLCVYEQGKSNVNSMTLYNASPYGAGLYALSTNAGLAYATGRWAVTVPQSGQQTVQQKGSANSGLRR